MVGSAALHLGDPSVDIFFQYVERHGAGAQDDIVKLTNIEPGPQRSLCPVPQFKDDSIDFSYSGVKAAAIRFARANDIRADGDAALVSDFCATFQDALFAQLFDRLESAWDRLEEPRPSEIAIAGGVAANGVLRERIAAWGASRGVIVRLPEKQYCTDNAAMIAFAGLQREADATDPKRVVARSRIR